MKLASDILLVFKYWVFSAQLTSAHGVMTIDKCA